MKKYRKIIPVILIAYPMMAGCAQQGGQTPQEQAASSCTAFGPKTTTGAVAGALLGSLIGGLQGGGKGALIGAASGAVVGGLAGKALDHNDCTIAQAALRQMDNAKVGAPIVWNNPSTGNSGVFVATSAPTQSANGQICRNYTRQATIGGTASGLENGVTCRNADGDWVAIA